MPARISLLLALLVPSITFAQTPQTFEQLAQFFTGLANEATALLVVTAIVIYFLGVVRHIIKTNQGKGGTELVPYLSWGIAVIFVMVSVWGIIRILENTLFGRSGSPSNPTLNIEFTDMRFN